MSARLQDFLLSVTLAAAVAMPVLGQTVDPGVGSPPNGRAAAPIPDFSGIWAHPYLPGFEPPASGPGPVLNRSRSRNGRANFSRLVGDYTNPILKPEAAEIVKKHGEMSLAGEGYPTPSNQCWPGGVPYIFWDYLLQMFQQPDKITMIYRHNNEVRRVRMNQPHPAEVTPSWYGDSVGHYEGDTLVIDTVGIKIGPFAMVDMYGTPHSPALHVVERYRLLDYDDAKEALARNEKENALGVYSEFDPNYRGKVLQLHFTVEDEAVFTMPWTATITYRPALGSWSDLICAENLREPRPERRAQSRPRTSRIFERLRAASFRLSRFRSRTTANLKSRSCRHRPEGLCLRDLFRARMLPSPTPTESGPPRGIRSATSRDSRRRPDRRVPNFPSRNVLDVCTFEP